MRNSYFDFLEINNNIAPNIRKDQDELVSDLKQNIRSKVEGFEQSISGAKRKHENKIQEYLGNTRSAILIGSFAVPTIMSLLTLDGWDKLWFIAFCIPILSQIFSILLIYFLITNYSSFSPGEMVFGWSLVLYLVGSIAYYFISKLSSKDEMEGKISKQKSLKEIVMPYLERVKGI